MTQTNPLQADAVVEQLHRAIDRETVNLPMKASTATISAMENAVAYISAFQPIPLQGGVDVRADIPEGWRVYTVDASIEGRWRVMLKGPDRDYPAEEDWPAHRGPAYVCQVGHDVRACKCGAFGIDPQCEQHGDGPAPSVDEVGWVVLDGDGVRYRCWTSCGPAWTFDLQKATRYARRKDAEAVHAEDEDAWRVVPFATEIRKLKEQG